MGAETGVMVTWFSATFVFLWAESVGRVGAGKATAPPENVTTPSMEDVVTTQPVVGVAVTTEAAGAEEAGKLTVLNVTPLNVGAVACEDDATGPLVVVTTLVTPPVVVRVTTPPLLCNWLDEMATMLAGIATCWTPPPGRGMVNNSRCPVLDSNSLGD